MSGTGIQAALNRVIAGETLDDAAMEAAMRSIMRGEATPAQIGGFLVALRMKGETVDEIAVAARVMREFARCVEVDGAHLVDIVGTGGDRRNTFNVSTTAAFVIAAAGGRVAKHNNRAVSSSTGSADVLEAAGVKIGLEPRDVARCIDEIGVGFMFAPVHHGATRHAAAPRRELGVRTLFNLLGPLTNPAQTPNALIGVFAREWVRPVAEVMNRLGARHVMVAHSSDGLDEISIAAPTWIAELRDGEVDSTEIAPEQFGIERGAIDSICVRDAQESLRMLLGVLGDEPGPARDMVLVNAAAAIYVAGLSPDLETAMELARSAISSGEAKRRLDSLISLSNRLAAL
jgi:anthranilate phosphoribosyltransferase